MLHTSKLLDDNFNEYFPIETSDSEIFVSKIAIFKIRDKIIGAFRSKENPNGTPIFCEIDTINNTITPIADKRLYTKSAAELGKMALKGQIPPALMTANELKIMEKAKMIRTLGISLIVLGVLMFVIGLSAVCYYLT